MKPLIVATPGGYITNWRHCNCGSETYANICGSIIVCGGCDGEFNLSHYDIKFVTTNLERQFEESING